MNELTPIEIIVETLNSALEHCPPSTRNALTRHVSPAIDLVRAELGSLKTENSALKSQLPAMADESHG